MNAVLVMLVVMNFFLTCWNLYLAHQRTKMQREDMHYKRKKRTKEGGAHRSHPAKEHSASGS